MEGLRLVVNGVVQGVGFRPFIYRLATRYGLTGWVQNTSAGVMIEVNGVHESLASFADQLPKELPPLARVESVMQEWVKPNGYSSFEIRKSAKDDQAFSLVPADVAICPDCLRELDDPADRRFRYPFINCTNCGPRYSIIQDMPYDRSVTTMSGFPMCPDCEKEYSDPENRRFHAEPIACPGCGPQVTLIQDRTVLAEKEEAISLAREMIKSGKIVAVKGLGGFLLACDAHNEEAVIRLRERKRRSQKAFALMAPSIETIRSYCVISPVEANLLTSRISPIVILDRLDGTGLSDAIAPGQKTLGMMLPYTPLHVLLCATSPNYTDLLVMTSGNMSEEPIIYRDDQIHRLDILADAYLTHNRPIHIREDDSVVRIISGNPRLIRRSRGDAPEPITLPQKQPATLACGALLKNTLTFTNEDRAFTSQFIGDLENMETLRSFELTIQHYQSLFKFDPQVIACDLHPDFLSTRFAEDMSNRAGKPLVKVQHHHAHMAACLAENNWNGDAAIGLCYDGTGYGTDGSIWGGEVLLGGYSEYHRAFHVDYMPLPGGDNAIRKPYRITLAYMHQCGLDWDDRLAPVRFTNSRERNLLLSQIEKRVNIAPTSSMGRLFDVVASIIGIGQIATYEGQLAIELEHCADLSEKNAYFVDIAEDRIMVDSLLRQIVDDSLSGMPVNAISAKFHRAIANLNLDLCRRIRSLQGVMDVALSGGVWQNKILSEITETLLRADGFTVLVHHQLPANDGCISFGQAVIAGRQFQERIS